MAFCFQKNETKKLAGEELSWDAYHAAFLEKAKEKQIPDVKAAALWKNHVFNLLEKRTAFFYDEARKRGMADIDTLWKDYKTEVLMKI